MYELAIIGGGPAGLTAAIFAERAGMDFVLLEQDGFGGGQIQTTERVDNYPGLYGIDGVELAEKLVEHCQALNVPILYQKVERIKQTDKGFLLTAEGTELETKAVIYAAGTIPKTLDVPGAKALAGQGVSYCATCDGAFFEGRPAAVIGSGDTAVEEAIYLSKICETVHLIYRKERLKAARNLQDKLRTCPNIVLHPATQVLEVRGAEQVQGLLLRQGGADNTLPCEGVFVAIGMVPVTGALADLDLCGEDGYIPAGETGETVLPGFFVAGDIRKKQLRQVLTAAADGANAVEAARRYLVSAVG